MNLEKYYTYDDILIKPKFSTLLSRKKACLKSKLTKNISLNLPIISSNMDTITEHKMAIEIAKNGGLGIIHRFCSIKDQVEMVKKVKRFTNFIISNPYTILIGTDMKNTLYKMKNTNHKSLIVIDETNKLKGIFTQRDLLFFENLDKQNKLQDLINDYMTNLDNMITISDDIIKNEPIKNIIKIMSRNKIQKLPIIDKQNKLTGLITLKDMLNRVNHTMANLDKNSQLVVGCAVGVNKDYLERTKAVIDAGCNIICIDVAHGHHILCGHAISEIKKLYPNIDVIAGNVCTAEGVRYLYEHGADCVKVGIGPGSICITRKQTGCGVPQFSAVLKCAEEAKKLGITIIADGGHNGTIGNIFKGLCAGSSASMLGGMLSGTYETPGQIYTKLNKKVKQIRGMAGILSNYNKEKKLGNDTKQLESITPEGVEGYVEYKGPVADILNQIAGGLRSGLSYIGCEKISEIDTKNIEFVLITNNGYKESGSHNIKEI